MKKLLIYALCFSILMLIFVGICLAVAAWGQEGCGEWKVRGLNQSWLDFVPEVIPFDVDSVWVPKPCPDIATVEEAKVDTNLCRVFGWIYDVDFEPLANVEVEAEIWNTVVGYGGIDSVWRTCIHYSKKTVTNDHGYWQLDLMPNSLLQPEGTRYHFWLHDAIGVIRILAIRGVPKQKSYELGWFERRKR